MAVTLTVCGVAGFVVPGAASAQAVDVEDGDSIVAARFRDRCDGGSDVQLPNPYSSDLVFDVNGERIVVGAQQRPWRVLAAPRRGRPATVQILVQHVAGAEDGIFHVWSAPSSCPSVGHSRLGGASRLSAGENGVADGDSIVAARFRDRCDGGSDVQLPNPYSSDLAFEVNGEPVVVGPQQQPWHELEPPRHGRVLNVQIAVQNFAGTEDGITHTWSPPHSCGQ